MPNDDVPEMPVIGGSYVFYESEARKMKIHARRMDFPGSRGPRPHFVVYKSVFPQPGQENMTQLCDFITWANAYRFGEGLAQHLEQRDIEAGYDAAFGPGKKT